MGLYTHVKDGTGAGTKKAARIISRDDWDCPVCGTRCRYYWRNCPKCFAGRDGFHHDQP